MSPVNLRYYVMAVKFPEQPNKSQGTAFLISLEDGGYAVTCHHVISRHTRVELYFQPMRQSIQAEFIPDHSNAGMDIAILKLLEARPTELQILYLSSEDCVGREFESFGFPRGFNGLIATGKVKGLVPSPAKTLGTSEEGLLQLSTTDVEEGMSGAPVVLSGTEDVVGMIVVGNRTQWNIHSDLAFAQTTMSIQESCGDLTPDSPIKSRQEWIRRMGFRLDPFLETDGGKDPYLSEYFFPVKNFLEISGDVSRPETVLVFGTKGSGKSSLRNAVARSCGDYGGLPVVYQDFGLLVDRVQENHRVQVSDHVTQILRAAIAAWAKEVEEEAISLQDSGKSTGIARNYLWSYVSDYETDPVRRQRLKNFLEVNGDESQPLPADYRDLLSHFCRYMVELLGYKCIYFLVDPDGDISPDVNVAWRVLEPLLSTQRLLELSDERAAFKFFLSREFLDQALQIPWIERGPGRIYTRSLEWPEDRLRALLRERLKGCSDKSPPYVSLGELSDGVADLDDIVIRRSGGEPRRLVAICGRLFSVHCQLPVDREHLLITREEVNEAIAQLGIREPVSKVAQLIAQGESSSVEFKSTIRYNLHTRTRDKKMEKEIASALCGFMNAEGGTLIIGVDDEGNALGLNDDFSTLRQKDEDGFELAFTDIVTCYLELPDRRYITLYFEDYDCKRICIIEVEKSHEPVYCLFDQKHEFYVRVGNSTRQLDIKQAVEYVREHFQEYMLSSSSATDTDIEDSHSREGVLDRK
jgi:hypothetical protein